MKTLIGWHKLRQILSGLELFGNHDHGYGRIIMGKKKSEDTKERDLDIVYSVRIKTFGKASKHIDDIGMNLSKLCALNFTTSEVTRGKTVYVWDGLKSSWGPLAKGENALVDGADYFGVVSNP